ncbi:P-loop containing nucleoside triphosphate hydrolase protein [Lipomyces oligophaga]|uniref:P-loop containing nucleoside triphosphate hydrolase protein n=1 Tax=Lipomyces oligophaga TaxID=45792 RepID=UPI0034CD7C86
MVDIEKQVFQAQDEVTNRTNRGPQLSFNEVEPTNVSVRNLTVSISPQGSFLEQIGLKAKANSCASGDIEQLSYSADKKIILDRISLDVPAGSIMAIIGGSGSGKTSLLNCMAHKLKSSRLSLNGKILYNGHENIRKVRYGYVLQQDILLPTLTARETLQYSADLRLPSDTSELKRRELVEEVILELGLKECADTRVGDHSHKGLSGGEKRRLSIGIQLLANPSVLFLDEPTSGLDAYSAQLLVQTLCKLAKKGRTVIASIHQPRADIFFLFDSITLLAKGKPVYCGSVKFSLDYFESLGFAFPEHANPADCMIDFAAYDSRTLKSQEESVRRIDRLVQSWRASENMSTVEVLPEPADLPQFRALLMREIIVLTKRSFWTNYRDPMGCGAIVVEAILAAIVTGWIFYDLDDSLIGIKSQLGGLYSAIASQGYIILMYEVYRLCSTDIKVYDRERSEGMVSVVGFIVSRRLSHLLTEDIASPLIYSALTYFMQGYDKNARKFFLFFISVFLQHLAQVSVALASVAISRDYSVAVLVANMYSTAQTMSCGFFIQNEALPAYVQWIKWLCFEFYGFCAIVVSVFQDFFGDCPYGDESDSLCAEYTGKYQLHSLAIKQNWLAVPLIAVIISALVWTFMAMIILKYKVVDVSVVGSKQSSESEISAEQDVVFARELPQRIPVEIQEVWLTIEKREIPSLKINNIGILRGVSAKFEPGRINAIMGPSGSGKSSLLNLIAQHLNSSILSQYYMSGNVLFKGGKISQRKMSSICSYVTQDDDGLLATLTVRETLQFAADLRLPSSMTREQRYARVEDLIARMGLNECANTQIGSEFVKGISGGEKRRVSIGVQLLSEPAVLLLDEPTTGLDSFTAASILSVLQSLANEGRTIVCTIHQPRSDLFSYFGNVLLLAKGGQVAYGGPGGDTILEHFQDAGYPCPPLTNPADHILDMVSVNLQDPISEDETRARVTNILERYISKIEKPITPSAHECENWSKKDTVSFAQVFRVLFRRSLLDIRRNPVALISRFGQIVGFGILTALFFSPIRTDNAGIQGRIAIIQQFSAMYFVGMLCNLAIYPPQQDNFQREHDDGLYGVLPFLICYTVFELPLEIINSLIFACLMVMVTGVYRTVGTFFAAAVFCSAIVNCGESIGIAFNAMFEHAGFAANMISFALTVGTMLSGIMSFSMMGFLNGFSYINPLMFGSKALLNYTFEGLTFSCDDSLKVNGECPFSTGEMVLDTYKVRVNKELFIGLTVVTAVYYRIIAVCVVKFLKLRLGVKYKEVTKLGS